MMMISLYASSGVTDKRKKITWYIDPQKTGDVVLSSVGFSLAFGYNIPAQPIPQFSYLLLL